MRSFLRAVSIMMFGASLLHAQNAPVKVIKPTKMDVSLPLRDLAKKAQLRAQTIGQEREVPNILEGGGKRSKKPGDSHALDPLLQSARLEKFGDQPPSTATITLNFEGASNSDNLAVVGGRVAPPDPNMDIGPNHIVQTINLITTIYNKSGAIVLGPIATDAFWDSFGGDCEFNNDGDPVVLYDHLADRWVISQFVFSEDECVCVSQTSDPTGAYYRFEFSTPGNDYPKLGLMPNAYFATIRNFSGAFNMDVAAMDRVKMLAGDPSATIQIFDLSAINPDVEGFIPADLDGPAPPAGTPGLIVGHNGGPTLVHNELEVYRADIDFNTPANSSLSLASIVAVTQFDLNISTVPQPSPGSNLDVLAQFTMNRAGLRDMGSYLAMVLNHTVDVNDFANHAGIRWYEIRDNTQSGDSWTLFQQGTHSPNSTHRWMGSIAMNANGDIGLAYTASSTSTFPSIRVTGRLASDPAGQMTMTEETVIAGTGAQTGTGRWGDYSSLSVDPSDNVTFSGTHEYVQTTGSFNWWTRIFSFQVVSSPPPAFVSRMNSGGSAFTAGGGNVFAADVAFVTGSSGYVGGTTASFSGGVANTTDDAMYRNYRRSSTSSGASFQYNFTVPNATYNVTLHLAAPSGTTSNPFQMDVTAEGNLIYDNLNINAEAGGSKSALLKTFSQSVTDGVLNLNFVRVNQRAIVNAIEVVQASAALGKDELGESAATASAPEDFQLHQNYPNPFNPSTRIRFDLPQAMAVKLVIYNTLGEEVRTLVQHYREAGSHEVQWDGRLSSGARATSGVYLYRLEGEGLRLVRKMTLLQ